MEILQGKEHVVGGFGFSSWGRSLEVQDRGPGAKIQGRNNPHTKVWDPVGHGPENPEESDGIWGSWEDWEGPDFRDWKTELTADSWMGKVSRVW